MKTKFELMLYLAPIIGAQYNYTKIGAFFDVLNHSGPGDSLRGIVDTYDKPVGAMVQDAAEWFFNGHTKPEWLTHAGY